MRKRISNKRGGYVMVLFAMLLFGIMAMAALVIDIGFARLAQRQMQSATDSASLEGLRFRDIETETERRQGASNMVANFFDDDLELSSDTRNFGAGPIVKFQESTSNGGVYANEFIFDPENTSSDPKIGSLPKVPVYKPVLATNASNQIDGDMVAGSSYDPRQVHTEDANYNRDDFVPSSPDNLDSDFFLVRMRRIGEFADDARTSGPTLPYLFARGALMFDRDSPEDPRRLINQGIKIRSTSIAAANPAVRVGPSVTGVPGILPVAFDIDNWNGSTADAIAITSNVSNGLSIGEALTLGAAISPTESGYCAIYQTTSSNVDRVVGFGWIGPMAPAAKMKGNIASLNATSRLSEAWPSLGSLTEDERNAIRDLNMNLQFPLLAPVLVR